MTAAISKLSQKMSSVAVSWPTDPFRPNLQLKDFLKSLSTHPNLTPQAVTAARTLMRNQIQEKYPLSEKLLKPASMPMHYHRLVEGFEKSAKGIGRPWWKIFIGKW